MGTQKQQVFEVIFDAHGAELYRYITYRIDDPALVEDIAAAAFAKLWERMHRDETIGNPRALLYTIAHGLVVDRYRSAARWSVSTSEEVLETLSVEDTHVEALDMQRDYARVLDAVRELEARYQEVILLYYVEELPITDISAILGETENNVRVRLHRATAKLKSLCAPAA